MTPASESGRPVTFVIWGALLTGCAIFLGVASYLRGTGQLGGDPAPELLPWLGLGLAAAAVAASFVVPGLVRGPPGLDAVGIARARLVVGWALREGAALVGITFWLISGDGKALAAAAIGLAALAAAMPTAERWRAAIEAAGGKPDRSPMVR
jgi:hypothetical protein